jgi:hypothetical protein
MIMSVSISGPQFHQSLPASPTGPIRLIRGYNLSEQYLRNSEPGPACLCDLAEALDNHFRPHRVSLLKQEARFWLEP